MGDCHMASETEGILEISLLGTLCLKGVTQGIVPLRTRKVQSLLAILATPPDEWHERARLASVLWPDLEVYQARHNLRQTLLLLRRTLEEALPGETLLEASSTRIRLATHPKVKIDVAAFLALASQLETHSHRHLEACVSCLERAERLARLYGGDFLGQWTPDTPELMAWCEAQRRKLLSRGLKALQTLISALLRQEEPHRALDYALRWVELDGDNEAAHRALMRVLSLTGQRAEAIRHYEQYEQALEREGGRAPEPETGALFDVIWAGRVVARSAVRLESCVGSPLPIELTPLFGYRRELTRLQSLCVEATQRLVGIVGPPGCGKTRMAVEVARAWGWSFPGGIHYYALGRPDGKALLETLMRAPERPSARPGQRGRGPEAGLERESRGSHAEGDRLLILDDAEGLLQDPLQVNRLKALSAKGLVLFTATGHPADLEAPLTLLPGLDIPAGDDPEAQAASPAIQFFLDRARRVCGGGLEGGARLRQVAQLCRAVEGLPAWLELLAYQLEQFTLETLCERVMVTPQELQVAMFDIADHHRDARSFLAFHRQGLPERWWHSLRGQVSALPSVSDGPTPGGMPADPGWVSYWLHDDAGRKGWFWPPPLARLVRAGD